MTEIDNRRNERAWQRIRANDPWRGRGAVSTGRVTQVGRGRISQTSFGKCVRIEVDASKDVPAHTQVFWVPGSALRSMAALPTVGKRIAFLHHLRLGVRALHQFKHIPPGVHREYDREFDIYVVHQEKEQA